MFWFLFWVIRFRIFFVGFTISIRDHPFSKYAKFSEKLTFLPPDTHTYSWHVHACVRIRGKNISFSGNFAYVLNGWSRRNIRNFTSCTFFKEYVHVRIWIKFMLNYCHFKHLHPNLDLVGSNNGLNITRNFLFYYL